MQCRAAIEALIKVTKNIGRGNLKIRLKLRQTSHAILTNTFT